jgi:hypothetical protein
MRQPAGSMAGDLANATDPLRRVFHLIRSDNNQVNAMLLKNSGYKLVTFNGRPEIKRPALMQVFVFAGVADGVRTHDNRNHNPGLYR